MRIYGLLYTHNDTMVSLRNIKEDHTPLLVGRVILRRLMRTDDPKLRFNSRTRVQWLKDCVDYMNECGMNDTTENTIEGSLDSLASDVIYSNAPHIIGMDMVEVNDDFREKCYNALVSLFEEDLKKEAEKAKNN